jgi:hypothetical protein
MSIFDQIVHAVKDVAEVAIETAVPILPHDMVEELVDTVVDGAIDVVTD